MTQRASRTSFPFATHQARFCSARHSDVLQGVAAHDRLADKLDRWQGFGRSAAPLAVDLAERHGVCRSNPSVAHPERFRDARQVAGSRVLVAVVRIRRLVRCLCSRRSDPRMPSVVDPVPRPADSSPRISLPHPTDIGSRLCLVRRADDQDCAQCEDPFWRPLRTSAGGVSLHSILLFLRRANLLFLSGRDLIAR